MEEQVNEHLMASLGESIHNNLGDYGIVEQFSRGGEGFVFKIRERKKNNEYALKVIWKKPGATQEVKAKIEAKIKNEINIHRQLSQCGSIITLRNVFEDSDNCYLVLEFCPSGDLTRHIQKNGKLGNETIRGYVRQVSEGILFLHNNGIVHRDIKPQNILISREDIAKVSDFGLAAKGEVFKDDVGTLNYIAPQILMKQKYDKKVDMWSLGCTLYYMATGTKIFNFQRRSQAVQHFLNKQETKISYPQGIDSHLKSLIDKLVVRDPKGRLSAEEVLHSEYLNPKKVVELSPLKTSGIRSSRMQTDNGFIRIDENGITKEACQAHSFQFRVSLEGTQISICKSKQTKTYRLVQLPPKYHDLYNYTKNVARILHQNSPSTVLQNRVGKFEILNSGKFVARLSTGTKIELKDSFDLDSNDQEQTAIAKRYYLILKQLS